MNAFVRPACRPLGVLFFLTLTVVFFCSDRGAFAEEKMQSPQVPLVFIHGIKGSYLKDPEGRRLWVGRWQVLNFSHPNLSLPLRWGGSAQERDHVTPDGVMGKLSILPGLLEKDVYGPWLEMAGKLTRPFYAFSYDWRRDNLETEEKFATYIKEISGKHHSPVQVVAHSMGGLITCAVLNRDPSLFQSVVFAGVPFQGGIAFLLDLHKGTRTGLNAKILSPDVLFSFPSVFTLFPETSGNRMLDANSKVIQVDFYSAPDWEKNRLSVFANKMPQLTEAQRAYLGRALQSAKEFRNHVVPRQGAKYPKILVLRGNTKPTLAQVMQGGPKSVGGWDFDTAPTQLGDERVSLADGAPFPEFQARIVDSRLPHSDLLNDERVPVLVKELSAQ